MKSFVTVSVTGFSTGSPNPSPSHNTVKALPVVPAFLTARISFKEYSLIKNEPRWLDLFAAFSGQLASGKILPLAQDRVSKETPLV